VEEAEVERVASNERQMGMGRHEKVVKWAFSASKFDAVPTKPPGSPEMELVSLWKAEGRRPSLEVCVAKPNPG
jgi:hypothetical protein